MSARGVTLIKGTIVVLEIDRTLAYIEDVQPTYAAVVALPEQMPGRQDTVIFTPGRVGAKKISPFASAARTVPVTELSDRNKEFIGTYEQLRAKHGPNFVQRTPEQEAAMSVVKAQPTRVPRGEKGLPVGDRAARRKQRKAAKVPCVTCGNLPIHPSHHIGTCTYLAPVKKERAPRGAGVKSEPKVGATYRVVNPDITTLQASNDKFAQGNRYYRVFLALKNLEFSTGTLANIIAAVALDAGKPMTNPEKVARRSLKALVDAGNVQLL